MIFSNLTSELYTLKILYILYGVLSKFLMVFMRQVPYLITSNESVSILQPVNPTKVKI